MAEILAYFEVYAKDQIDKRIEREKRRKIEEEERERKQELQRKKNDEIRKIKVLMYFIEFTKRYFSLKSISYFHFFEI